VRRTPLSPKNPKDSIADSAVKIEIHEAVKIGKNWNFRKRRQPEEELF
jgi:hypothetical protein